MYTEIKIQLNLDSMYTVQAIKQKYAIGIKAAASINYRKLDDYRV